MFDNLTDRLSRTLRNISGRGRLTEDNIKDTLREVRMALLEADVALPVVRDFISRVKESAVGHEVNKSLTPVRVRQNRPQRAGGGDGRREPDARPGRAAAGRGANGGPARCW